nr:sushi, von Willebrand factor type A, EGF and pentraxin domain-containing protein 1 [Ciona intestinalis]|eukprot:XP_018671091.1 sushi, von Willebrand factor type A, EGF and pentraxin domain-containing protein 1 [Ciona intestinalis]
MNLRLLLLYLSIAVLSAHSRRVRAPSRIRRRTPVTGSAGINIQDSSAQTIQVGFRYIQGAVRYRVSAKEWIDGTYEQTVATNEKIVGIHQRQATLQNLDPGREYLIQVQGLNRASRPIGSVSEHVAGTALRCYTCNGRASNRECNTRSSVQECPAGTDSCLNEVRYQNGIATFTKRCAQFQPRLARKMRGNVDITASCRGVHAKDAVCQCMCKSDLCNAADLPCSDRCFPRLRQPRTATLHCTNGDRVGSVCTWRCRGQNARAIGITSARCRTDRTWSVLTPPRCVLPQVEDPVTTARTTPYECPTMAAPPNTRMRCLQANRLNSVCTFTCTSGYTLTRGSATRTCGRTGYWSGSVPLCTAITCPAIPPVPYLVINCDNNRNVGSNCELSCTGQLTLIGQNEITCRSNGRWSHVVPRCERRGCQARPRVGRNILMECEEFTQPSEGARCHYSCKPGYEMRGTPSSVCLNNRWSNAAPLCSKTRCRPDMGQPAFGWLQCSDYSNFDSNCTFTCRAGYVLRGAPVVRCLASTRWSHSAPTCERVSCPPIPHSVTGTYSCNNAWNAGSVCTLSCNTGYGRGSSTRQRITCNANPNVGPSDEYMGRWSPAVSHCEKSRCAAFTVTPGMRRSCSKSDYREIGSVCRFSCDPGYFRAGRSSRTCRRGYFGVALGRWSAGRTYCIRRSCPRLTPTNFGAVSCSDGIYAGSNCTVTCERGYEPTSEANFQCAMNGRWNRPKARCTRVVCRAPTEVTTRNIVFTCGKDARNNPVVQRYFTDFECPLRCSSGFLIIGGNSSKCGTDGEWIISQSLECADVDECAVNNGGCDHFCSNEMGGYQCSCRENYQLNADGATCRRIFCPEFPPDSRSSVTCTNERSIGSTCVISCVTGYEPRGGGAELVCRNDGTWNELFATCLKVECPPLRVPTNGTLSCSEDNLYQSVCRSTCDVGFNMIGVPDTSCTEHRVWTQESPTCRRVRCPEELTHIDNGVTMCSDANFYNSDCHYACNVGYQFVASPQETLLPFGLLLFPIATCMEDGTWSLPAPSCEKKQCLPTFTDVHSVRPNSQITCTDSDLFDSTCTMSCDAGYELIGQIRSRCLSTQTWSHDLGQCEKIRCPSTLPPHDGAISCNDTNRYESTCQYTCNEGYNMVGVATLLCQADRTWSAPSPTCQRIQCNESRTAIANGIVTCTMDNYYASDCSASCNAGYEFDEANSLGGLRKSRVRAIITGIEAPATFETVVSRCLATGEWDSEAPSCVKHSCEPSEDEMRQARSNGEVECTDSQLFMSSCTLRCHNGYEVTGGSPSVQCGSTRQWSAAMGTCQKIRCNEFDELNNGRMNCSEDNLFESVCSFECSPGYDLVGSATSTCLANTSFSHPKPSCQKIECPTSHTTLMNGAADCTDGSRFESRCVYVCNPGYEMTDSPTSNTEDSPDTAVLTCTADRTWNGRLPYCKRKQCSMHDGAITRAKLNGNVVCTESSWYGSHCSVTCNEGYVLVGSLSTQCTASADWAPTIGHCNKVRCPALSQPQDGSMTCTDENKFESVCSFSCDRGYERIGAASSTCQSNRTFTQDAPTCREILCPIEFTTLANGNVVCSDSNRFDSHCEHTCDDGYQLTEDSSPTTRCQIDYQWNVLNKPVCVKKLCSHADPTLVNALDHGSIDCSDDMRYQSQCTLTCNIGYEKTGSGNTVCLADQTWSENFGVCRKIECPPFTPPINGGVTCSDANRYQSNCLFHCDAGYEIIGEVTSQCQHNRSFNNEAPICQKTRCPTTHLTATHATTVCSESNLFESVCGYECIPGYEVTQGVTTVTCMDDQTWSGEKVTCEKKVCSSNDTDLIKAERNGQLTCTDGHIFNSVCSLQCDIGYRLIDGGLNETRCNEDGVWEATIGYCIKIECPVLIDPVNGRISCSENSKYLSECEFECHAGYEVVGSATTLCQADKTWTNVSPTCQRISCPSSHLTLTHGFSSCTITNKFESVCTYQCNQGYEMSSTDSNQSECTDQMMWTNQKPTCMKKKCPMNSADIVKASLIGEVVCSEENLYESQCSLDCPPGYEVTEGNSEITCTHTAQWSGTMGYCQRISCGVLTPPTNSTMVCSNQDKYESTCEFTCTPGYYRAGEHSTTCQANGTYSNQLPSCHKISCPDDHNSVQFGTVNCTEGNLFQSVCTYQCNEGYQVFGSYITEAHVTSQCQYFGEWTEEVPICEKKTCSHEDEAFVAAMETGMVDCSDANRAGSVCRITCRDGHHVIGQNVITCTSAGAWSGFIGYCENIECSSLTPPNHGDITCTSDHDFASTCTYQCNEGYQFITSNQAIPVNISTRCTADTTWTLPTQPQCQKKQCPLWSSFNNGIQNCTDNNNYMSQCLYVCDDGYRLVQPSNSNNQHSEVITCGSEGVWDVNEEPQCTRIMCSPNTTQIQQSEPHGVITCTNNALFQSQCLLQCNKGYELGGDNNVTSCGSSLEWMPVLSSCEKIQCPPLMAPTNGQISCSEDNLFKSRCKVTCDVGYEVVDPEDDYDVIKGIQCRADGTWCGEVPECRKITCPSSHMTISHGSVVCSDSNIYQSRCSYHCDVGYHMIQGQVDTAECMHTKMWNNPTPTCDNNRCPANDTSIQEALVFGDVTCTDENKFGSRCLLRCYDGYEMSGEPGTNCLESGVWSNGIGLCSKIECSRLDVPHTTLRCTDGAHFQSICVFDCIEGYTLEDPTPYNMVCQADGSWVGNTPTCQKINCPAEPIRHIENGQVSCDNGYKYESQCVFVCDPGFTIHHSGDYYVTTLASSCLANGTWDFVFTPQCVRVTCPTMNVMNGRLNCSESSTYGSRCALLCDNGYQPSSQSVIVNCDVSGQWWPQLATCQKLTCPTPSIPNTHLTCSDGHKFASICSFSGCDHGYEALGDYDVISCMGDGQWLGSAPQCTKKTCSASFLTLNNGRVLCNNSNYFQSECEFLCNNGYELNQATNIAHCGDTKEWDLMVQPACMLRRTCASSHIPYGTIQCKNNLCRLNCDLTSTLVGASESNCTEVNGILSWSTPLGTCLRQSCPALTTPTHATMDCNNRFKFRSVCRFRCSRGYRLSGSIATRCNAGLQWTNQVPSCEVISCNASFQNIEHGNAVQSNSNIPGSVTTYTCDDGYQLDGQSQVTCNNNGQWSSVKPQCKRLQCPPLHIANGGYQCNRDIHNEMGSECNFTCNQLHQLDGNHTTTICGSNGQWTNQAPYCRGHCDVIFNHIDNGQVTCTNSNYHHSQCSFQCNPGTLTNPITHHGSHVMTCQSNGRWGGTPPCCAESCPTRTKVDLYIVLESSTSGESDDWNRLLGFVETLIRRFSIDDSTTLVGLLRYHRNVDVIGEVSLGRYRNIEELSRAVKFLPYGGYGSNIGQTLEHLATDSLLVDTNRPNVRDHVILFTDGSSDDNVTASAGLLKQRATVQVVGMDGTKTQLQQLEEIATKPSYVHTVSNISQLGTSVIDAIIMNMCQNPCLLSQSYQNEMHNYIQV